MVRLGTFFFKLASLYVSVVSSVLQNVCHFHNNNKVIFKKKAKHIRQDVNCGQVWIVEVRDVYYFILCRLLYFLTL